MFHITLVNRAHREFDKKKYNAACENFHVQNAPKYLSNEQIQKDQGTPAKSLF
jgi:hypothetical protein